MFGIRFKSERNKAKGGEERLSGLLKAWKGPEPKANFEAAVWRRIRAAAAPTPSPMIDTTLFHSWWASTNVERERNLPSDSPGSGR